MIRQGLPPEILVRRRVRFEESLTELLLPLGIAAIFVSLATLNLTAPDIGRRGTWIIQPLLLIVGGLLTAGQVFAVRFVEARFRKSPERDERAVNARGIMEAASAAFPVWLRPTIVTRFVLVTLGSAFVLLLLAVG